MVCGAVESTAQVQAEPAPSLLRLPRYLVHFSDGGAGMRHYDRELVEGQEISDGVNGVYVVERVKPPAAEGGLSHAWAAGQHGQHEPPRQGEP